METCDIDPWPPHTCAQTHKHVSMHRPHTHPQKKPNKEMQGVNCPERGLTGTEERWERGERSMGTSFLLGDGNGLQIDRRCRATLDVHECLELTLENGETMK